MPRLHVICGHGAGDPGACGNGYSEAERVRALGREIKRRGGSDVVLHDTSVNYYANKAAFYSLSVPKGECAVELHMDAAAGARGGHVIIPAGYGGADGYDRALASGIARLFPGRAQSIVERANLANPNRARSMGMNYRLVENGFITSATDVATFNSRLGDLADLYLDAFGIRAATPEPEPEPEPEPSVTVPEAARGVHRLYNASTGEHFLTRSRGEAQSLVGLGWDYEGVAWREGDGEPVERLYNPFADGGDHHYTTDVEEHNALVAEGWLCEGEAFRAGTARDAHRLYNPNDGRHHVTADPAERDALVRAGWDYEGVLCKVD